MKINDQRTVKDLYFKDLAQGEVFICEDEFYLKTATIRTDYGSVCNAVDLCGGEMCFIGETELVSKPECELILK